MTNKLLKAAVLTLGLATGAVANAGIVKSYDFNGDLADTLGNGVDMTASGGSVSGGRYVFGDNQGLRLTDALDSTTDYGIEMKLQGSNFGGYNKLIDFQDLGSDLGLYVLNDVVVHYVLGFPGTPVLDLNEDFTVGIERSGTTFSTYVNGSLVFSADDSGGQAVSSPNILNFFEDDLVTGQRESFAGSVDWIRIHDDASTFGQMVSVPAPAAPMMFLLGLGLIGLRRVRLGSK